MSQLQKNEEFNRLQAEEITPEEDSTKGQMLALLKTLEDHERRIRRLEGSSAPKPLSFAKPVSIREFILEKQPKNDVERTLVIGYFLEHDRTLGSFNTKDLAEAFREAKENIPANVNLAVIRNVQKGFFMEAGEKRNGLKAWTLTNGGMSHLEGNSRVS
jgi:hypothetical protein